MSTRLDAENAYLSWISVKRIGSGEITPALEVFEAGFKAGVEAGHPGIASATCTALRAQYRLACDAGFTGTLKQYQTFVATILGQCLCKE